MKSFMAD